jgi:hypothetical protein
MARNQGSSTQNSSKLGHSKYQVNCPEKSTWKKLTNCEVRPQAVWPIVKSLLKRGGPKAPSAIHGPLGAIIYPINKANIIADCIGNPFRAHDLCDCHHRGHVEAQVEVPMTTVDEDIPVIFRPCDVSKEIQSLKLRKAHGFDGIRNECVQEDHLCI